MESNVKANGEMDSCCWRREGEGNGISLGESMEACLFENDGNRGMVVGRGAGEEWCNE